MRTRATATLLSGLALVLVLVLPACGSASQAGATSGGAAEAGSSAGTGSGSTSQQRARGELALKRIGSFDHPVYITGAPGFRKLLFVVEQPGRVVVLRRGHRLRRPFLDIRSRVAYEGERGLLSIAFPPDYASSGRFYVYYTDGDGNIRIDEFRRRSATRAAAGSRRTVIRIPHPENSNHNGGQLQFLGNLLYFGTGDGGSGGDPPNNAQNKRRPARQAAADRSPAAWRPPLHRARLQPVRQPARPQGDLQLRPAQPLPLLLRHGQRAGSRGSRSPTSARTATRSSTTPRSPPPAAPTSAGTPSRASTSYEDANSGTPDPGGTTKPILAYPHSRGGSCSIIGGYVVADRRLRSLYKRYVYADLCEGQLRSLVPHLKRAAHDRRLGLSVSSPTSFGEDGYHRLYVASLDGPVYRLVER